MGIARLNLQELKQSAKRASLGNLRLDARALEVQTQAEFAERIGVSQPQYHRYECGERPISSVDLYLLAESLELRIDQLFPPQDLARLSTDEKELLEAWRRRDLKSLLKLVGEQCG